MNSQICVVSVLLIHGCRQQRQKLIEKILYTMQYYIKSYRLCLLVSHLRITRLNTGCSCFIAEEKEVGNILVPRQKLTCREGGKVTIEKVADI